MSASHTPCEAVLAFSGDVSRQNFTEAANMTAFVMFAILRNGALFQLHIAILIVFERTPCDCDRCTCGTYRGTML